MFREWKWKRNKQEKLDLWSHQEGSQWKWRNCHIEKLCCRLQLSKVFVWVSRKCGCLKSLSLNSNLIITNIWSLQVNQLSQLTCLASSMLNHFFSKIRKSRKSLFRFKKKKNTSEFRLSSQLDMCICRRNSIF